MQRGYILVLICLFGILMMRVPSVEAQWALVGFTYYDDGQGDLEPPITDGADQPAPDGTVGLVMHDLGEPGPDPADTSLGGFGFNGESLGFAAGYFFTEAWIVTEAGRSIYVVVTLPNRCWYTIGYVVVPGLQNIMIADDEWTSAPPPCAWNLPTASVVFWYCIHAPWYLERPIGCPCDTPGNDTLVAVMHDVNTNGPDGTDSTLTSFIALENVPDCIWVSPAVVLPANFPVYLQIGIECCWTTNNFIVASGEQGIELVWQSWRCADAPCALDAEEHPIAFHPDRFEITGIYPNPFNSEAQIEFLLPQNAVVTIDIYDLVGRHVATLTDGMYTAGTHRIAWDAQQPIASGVYFCRAFSQGFVHTRKLLLLR